LRYRAENKQTDRQTLLKILPPRLPSVSVIIIIIIIINGGCCEKRRRRESMKSHYERLQALCIRSVWAADYNNYYYLNVKTAIAIAYRIWLISHRLSSTKLLWFTVQTSNARIHQKPRSTFITQCQSTCKDVVPVFCRLNEVDDCLDSGCCLCVCVCVCVQLLLLLSPVHTSNNVEAIFNFVVERPYRKILPFRRSRNTVNLFNLLRSLFANHKWFKVARLCD